MDQYNLKRIESIKTKLDPIIRKATLIRQTKIKPYRKDINIALNVIKDFIIERKRIIYGGMSQNEFIKIKNKKDAIYPEDSLDIPDYDIYSPTPVYDIIYLCNKLFNMGYTEVSGGEAVHEGTYSLRLDRITGVILDIHYMWNSHYNLIKTKKIGNFYFAHPDFMFIDLYKIYTDPLLSYGLRLTKVFNRCSLLEKYYPIEYNNRFFNNYQYKKISDLNLSIINKIIENYISNNTNIILCGIFAYNFFVSKVDKSKITNLNYLSLIVEDISLISKEIIDNMIKIGLNKEDIKINNYYQFYEVFDSVIKIKYKNIILFEIIGNLNRCIPFISVKNSKKIKLQIISFHGLLYHFYTFLFLYKFQKKNTNIEFIRCLIAYLHSARIQYLKKNNLLGIEPGIFAELIINCKFNTIDDRLLHEKRIQSNKKKGKQYVWQYRPINKIIELNDIPKFIYPNTSGNIINKN